MVGIAAGVVAAAATYGIIRSMQGTSAAATEEGVPPIVPRRRGGCPIYGSKDGVITAFDGE